MTRRFKHLRQRGRRVVLKAIDLFAGAGGLSLGLAMSGIDVIGAVEYDAAACTTYRHNHGNHVVHADITSFGPLNMERHLKAAGAIQRRCEVDLVAGGLHVQDSPHRPFENLEPDQNRSMGGNRSSTRLHRRPAEPTLSRIRGLCSPFQTNLPHHGKRAGHDIVSEI